MAKPDTTTRMKQIQHPLQSEAWGEFRKKMGIDVERISWQGAGLAEGARPEPVEGQLTFHRVPHTPWTIGYFPKGPNPTPSMIDALVNIGQKHKTIFIQLEPNVRVSDSEHRAASSDARLHPSHHPLFTKYTFILDLTKSEEELLKAMHSKTRYNLRVAQKHGVVVQEDNTPRGFEAYLRLNKETTGRQGFFAHNELYHRTMWQVMNASGIAKLFTATYEGEILAAWIIFCWNDTLYYPYGTSSREHREVMAPTMLLWEIARWGKQQGFKYFDLWGAMGPIPDSNDPWYGFHRFKQGFNPIHVEFVGSFDLVIKPALYRLYILADRIRWAVLKLKKRG